MFSISKLEDVIPFLRQDLGSFVGTAFFFYFLMVILHLVIQRWGEYCRKFRKKACWGVTKIKDAGFIIAQVCKRMYSNRWIGRRGREAGSDV
jgi:hypothetical protein